MRLCCGGAAESDDSTARDVCQRCRRAPARRSLGVVAARSFVAAVAFSQAPLAAARYGQPPCASPDEVQGELQGASGNLCAPRCDPTTYNCPVDVPYGSTAQPQCMIKDVDQTPYCALLCQVDSQCPSGSRCTQLKQVEVGICLFPVAFTDWARSAANKKFAVGWPKASGGTIASFQIAKTYTALQNLKSRYSIDDGDGDMVTLKEFLSSLSGTSGGVWPAPPAGYPPMGAMGAPPLAGPQMVGGVGPQFAQNPMAVAPMATVAAPSPAPSSSSWWGSSDVAPSKWQADAQYFKDNVLFGGVSGISKEVHDTIWNVEHIDKRGVASELLRSSIMLGLAYLGIGCLIKSQLYGARGYDMVPHIGFWQEYPGLVADGITYTQILAGGWLGSPAKGGFDTGITGGLGSRGHMTRGVGSFDAL